MRQLRARQLVALALPLWAAAALEAQQPSATDKNRDRSARWLALLPDGVVKQRFIRDCTGCHQFDDIRAMPQGSARTRDGWKTAIERMLGYGGPTSTFPVISRHAQPDALSQWLAASLQGKAEPFAGSLESPGLITGRAQVDEYDTPVASDLPHDLQVDANGKVIITGMMTHEMYLLDPATRRMETIEIPVERANPRAVELDGQGRWWVLLGRPGMVARYDPRTKAWGTWEIGMYPHSLAVAADGRIWFNGHFTQKPELLGVLDPASGSVKTFEIPPHPIYATGDGGPVPYEQRLAPDGSVWMSELTGDRMVRHDPRTGTTKTWAMPGTESGPRRFDVAPDGVLWIPAYSGNKLVRFDPTTEKFTEIPLPVKDAVPYVARIDARGQVWVGLSAAERVLKYDPRTSRWTSFALPTKGAMVRHMAFDPANGDVWLAYGASPGIHPSRVARVRELR